ncbi:MAG: GH92 family glycosyl hydrolase [Bacteroidota bacterium]|nr:GH92 family glycosyl hydrolase [Bacteroidota bacterium]
MNLYKRFAITVGFILCVAGYFSQQNFSQYVNPFIGTAGHGHTFPGAVLPFGMVQLSPDTRIDGSWDGCSGYHFSDSIIYGFSHTHLSGTGCSDWGDILLMPMLGEPSMDTKIYSSKFSHKNEKATAGYYQVLLDDDKINVELTTTLRTGIHKYTFPKSEKANLILDLLHRDKTLNCNIRVLDSVTISGFRISQAWAKEQHIYFILKFSKPFKKMAFAVNKTFKPGLDFKTREQAQGAYFQFDNTDEKPLLVKASISLVNTDGALKNMLAEAPNWNFENYKNKADSIWNKQLQKIEVTDDDKNKLTTFYTALYHCFIHPSLSMDVDSMYRGRNNQTHKATGFTNYSVFSLWDTYRALHPLFTLIERKRTVDFINTFLYQYKQSKRLPMWELSANETDCMIGFHSASVITDALEKGIDGFDTLSIYEALKASASYSNFGIPTYNKKRFLEIEDESENVSKSLEYSYDNWCISKVAEKLNKLKEAQLYAQLAQTHKNLFDMSTGFMRPRKNGGWLSPFNPTEINNHFTEGNSWQYSFYVPHDIEGLIKLHGGKQNFEKKLDELFNTTEKLSGREQSDVTGLIGQYAHGNEPSHHIAYLYNFVGKPQKTINTVQKICNEFYNNSPDGLIGNEDCGQMSAWYVFSAMGFYPVCPGSVQYVLSQPIFKNIKINFEDGKSFEIENNFSENKRLAGYTLNKRKLNRTAFTYNQIQYGAKLAYLFLNINDSSNIFIKDSGMRTPVSRINYEKYAPVLPKIIPKSVKAKYESKLPNGLIIPAPIINAESQIFKTNLEISITNINYETSTIVYTTDGSEPNKSSSIYFKPFKIDSTSIIKAKIYDKKDSSITIVAKFYKLKYNYDITVSSKANSQYNANGPISLVDGLNGEADWRKGNWLGYQNQDFECVVDLKNKRDISFVSLNCLQDSRSWILMPTQVDIYVSNDNKKFSLVGTVENHITPDNETIQTQKFEKQLAKFVNARYVKIVAKNFGKLPDWHLGKGDNAFIFVDEIEIK